MAIMRFAAARAPEQRSEVLHSPQGQASGFLLFSPALNNSCRIGFITTTESLSKVDLDGELATELCYNVPWDEEHTLGARFRGTQWIELCGSTRVP